MDKHSSIINKVKKLVYHKLKNESSGHDFWHCQRVVRMVLKIGKAEKANLETLELAGWLHDLGVTRGRKNHEVRSAIQAEKFLKKENLNPELIAKVINCIRHHRFTTGKVETIEDKVLQDADKLDILGAIGMGRLFMFTSKYKRIVYDGKIRPNPRRYKLTGRSRSLFDHMHEKIFLLPDLLHTATARKIGRERLNFAKQFLKQYVDEWEGKK